ncbi:CAP domain-containing protein [Aurantimonas sp. MSK8Z-1]|uniref:CAP domain-containing protein n=1 Tax=Mangrovibrevibacter kandeliae TaxID=2968473 RepID=UPI002117E290|nr:CAP domain-containing protein [Aurantimonas sp. MSK8Z-1]MCW4114281.1 CAP domain-containing protein [Aurantimonas sp. MSK8Z-1]
MSIARFRLRQPARTDLRRLVLGAWLAVASSLAATSAGEAQDLDAWRQQALELMNKDRQSQDRSVLTLGDELNAAAQSHAEDMLARNYYSHTSPDGDDVQDRYRDAGGSRWELVEENIARCAGCRPPITPETLERLETGWMNSPHHRENILREGIARFGYGIVLDPQQGLYAVQTFAGPGAPRGPQDEAPTVLAQDDVATRAATVINRARSEEGVAAVEANAALVAAARSLLPDPDAEDPSLESQQNLLQTIPAEQRSRWRSVGVVSAACGGCGTEPTLADLRAFRRQWMNDPQYRQRLLDPAVTDVGFALQANGTGRKIAVLVLASAR